MIARARRGQPSHRGSLDATAQSLAADPRHLRLAERLADAMTAKARMPGLRDEFRSAAYLGLCQAARDFEPGRGSRFTTFALPRIRGAILDCARENLPQGFRRKGKYGDGAGERAIHPTTMSLSHRTYDGDGNLTDMYQVIPADEQPIGDGIEYQDSLGIYFRGRPPGYRPVMEDLFGRAECWCMKATGRRHKLSESRISQIHGYMIEVIRDQYPTPESLRDSIGRPRPKAMTWAEIQRLIGGPELSPALHPVLSPKERTVSQPSPTVERDRSPRIELAPLPTRAAMLARNATNVSKVSESEPAKALRGVRGPTHDYPLVISIWREQRDQSPNSRTVAAEYHRRTGRTIHPTAVCKLRPKDIPAPPRGFPKRAAALGRLAIIPNGSMTLTVEPMPSGITLKPPRPPANRPISPPTAIKGPVAPPDVSEATEAVLAELDILRAMVGILGGLRDARARGRVVAWLAARFASEEGSPEK